MIVAQNKDPYTKRVNTVTGSYYFRPEHDTSNEVFGDGSDFEYRVPCIVFFPSMEIWKFYDEDDGVDSEEKLQAAMEWLDSIHNVKFLPDVK